MCDDVPAAIYTIPPHCPGYPATYVHVYEATPETVVVGFLPGYEDVYIADGVLVYGLGYPFDYPAVYYEHRHKWWYDADHFNYIRLRDNYGHGYYYDHLTGRFHRSAEARAHQASRKIRSDPYEAWDKGVTASPFNEYRGESAPATPTGPLVVASTVRHGRQDLYASRDGNVYRNSNGNWQHYRGGQWSGATSRSQPSGWVNYTRQARSWGTNRHSQYRKYRSSRGRPVGSIKGLGPYR